ncbi:MAG: nucleotidyl transferase AbiEii/AbiGii toxin family protein [Parcubacteria group bacterium]
MLNWNKHKSIMVRILKDIYSDAKIAPWLGFKGGTACLLFYDLPRYSVDLDFDLLDEKKKELVFLRVKEIAEKYAEIKESYQKRNTIFLLLSYGEKDHNIKIEISTRNLGDNFEVLSYLGIPMKVMAKEDMFANKLVALLGRKTTASRDIFDLHYFFSKNWNIDEKIIKQRMGKSLDKYLKDCLKFIENFNNKDILHGLGELVDKKQKDWTRKNLKNDLIFLIKAYLEK